MAACSSLRGFGGTTKYANMSRFLYSFSAATDFLMQLTVEQVLVVAVKPSDLVFLFFEES